MEKVAKELDRSPSEKNMSQALTYDPTSDRKPIVGAVPDSEVLEAGDAPLGKVTGACFSNSAG